MKSSDPIKSKILVSHCARKNRANKKELPMHIVVFLRVESKQLQIFGIITGQKHTPWNVYTICCNMKMCEKCRYAEIGWNVSE